MVNGAEDCTLLIFRLGGSDSDSLAVQKYRASSSLTDFIFHEDGPGLQALLDSQLLGLPQLFYEKPASRSQTRRLL